MTTHKIYNYWDKDPLIVYGLHMDRLKPMVIIGQMAGSLTLQHSLTTAQAREMAAALLLSAEEADAAAPV